MNRDCRRIYQSANFLKQYPEDSVINLDALTYAGNIENLKTVESDPRYTFVKGDICDAELVGRLVRDVDAVVHFAGLKSVAESAQDPLRYYDNNLGGTVTLCRAMAAAGKASWRPRIWSN